MKNKIYIGNLSYTLKTDELKQVFTPFGEITDAIVISDKASGRSRGFGFVTFATEEQAQAALGAMDGQEVEQRPIRVRIAVPKETGQVVY